MARRSNAVAGTNLVLSSMRVALLISVLCTLLIAVPNVSATLETMAIREFECHKGSVILESGNRRVTYPPGKYEPVRLQTTAGLVNYTCQYIRYLVSCPFGTTQVSIERGPVAGGFRAKCLGEPASNFLPEGDTSGSGSVSDPGTTGTGLPDGSSPGGAAVMPQ